ncbi:Penicillin-binding protein 2D [Rhodobacteraceae bacterium THAF1]|uniref:monofunctional biosynthetic peptidoglycan transglycosylase n=1 Tax=Palleronia sp. THAF1 TaxID=2587842 RepID=UPI000F3C96F8|nr:monofunctional biosynthetic peptidoglycan transglycosylase [Palleronia sp. THAF1]QFU10064.1 Penicillin-binding protein 2D [Palleronia sp. THAF1]VDC17031.1 Penicillin-binding protein 2D [Rhodobacteraceae bacterium THAF1]
MAKQAKKQTKQTKTRGRKRAAVKGGVRRVVLRIALSIVVVVLGAVALFAVFNPPTTPYMASETRRLGTLDHQWIGLEEIAPVMARSVVAAEDANFCNHWGFDVAAIRAAIEEGGTRGGSTISQQVVKNVYLWQGRSWPRKALEALLTPLVEAVWSKRRVLEVYLNVAEFGEGVFGIDAASYAAFQKPPAQLSAREAARLASVLPNPKERSANSPSTPMQRRVAQIESGAATIAADGRSDCFED